jgi:hypothetical protein
MTNLQRSTLTILLYGSWKFDKNSNQRYFRGRILKSEQLGITKGNLATVTYAGQHNQVMNHQEQGGYTLKTAQAKLTLMSFLCEAIGQPGHEGRDDTVPAHWVARAILKTLPLHRV